MNDTNTFSTCPVKLSVISTEGGVWNVDVAPDITVEKLKTMALCHFHSPLACVQMTSRYKLVSVSEKRPLDNNNSILQEGLRNSGNYCPALLTKYIHTQSHCLLSSHLTDYFAYAVTRLTCISEVPASNRGQYTKYPHCYFCEFIQSHQEIGVIALGHEGFLSHSFQLLILQSLI